VEQSDGELTDYHRIISTQVLKMPHVNGSDGDDLGDADEIKVFKHDEECEEEKKLIAEERQSDSLTEDKSSLVTEGESQVNSST